MTQTVMIPVKAGPGYKDLLEALLITPDKKLRFSIGGNTVYLHLRGMEMGSLDGRDWYLTGHILDPDLPQHPQRGYWKITFHYNLHTREGQWNGVKEDPKLPNGAERIYGEVPAARCRS